MVPLATFHGEELCCFKCHNQACQSPGLVSRGSTLKMHVASNVAWHAASSSSQHPYHCRLACLGLVSRLIVPSRPMHCGTLPQLRLAQPGVFHFHFIVRTGSFHEVVACWHMLNVVTLCPGSCIGLIGNDASLILIIERLYRQNNSTLLNPSHADLPHCAFND